MGFFFKSDDHWLWVIWGVGGLLGLVFLGEIVAIALGAHHFPDAFLVGAISSLVAIVGLLYGGYWIATSGLSSERYQRMAGWCLFGGLGFLTLNLLIMQSMQPESIIHAVSWIRWAASLGGGAGFLIGFFEARAIERAQKVERLRIERQETERKNELLDEFASIVAHDFRNPLNIAEGRLQLAREEVESEHLDKVEKAHERMNTILEDTLLLARKGQAVGETKPVDLESLVNNCWETVKTKNAEIVVGPLPTVEADQNRLRHVFENLFRNAVEHGGENVTVRVGSLDDENGFFVEDNGPGIPPEEMEEVFDPRYTTTGQESGFGLSIVNRIVQAHGWEINVTVGDEGGARFEISDVGIIERS